MHINFFAGKKFNPEKVKDIHNFTIEYPSFQSLWLGSSNQLVLLFQLLGMTFVIDTQVTDFAKSIFDLSKSKYRNFDKREFDSFTKDEFNSRREKIHLTNMQCYLCY